VISVALKTPLQIILESVYIKRHFCIHLMTMLVSHQAILPTFYNKIAPMYIAYLKISDIFSRRAASEFESNFIP